MENKKITITENEQKTVQKHAQTLTQAVAKNGREAYYTYAISQGFTEEEAHTLIDTHVIPTVDEYNASCQAGMDNSNQLIRQKIAQRIEADNMDAQETAKFKLDVLNIICTINARILGQEPEAILTETERSMVENNEMTEEMLQKIDDALVAAVENSALPIAQTQAFVQFLEGNPECGGILNVNAELWKDHQAKYCAAAALCIAYTKDELPSIPKGISPKLLSAVACQGVDVAEIQAKVGRGEMTVDFAYKVLKIIAAAFLALLIVWGMIDAYLALVALGVEVITAVFGTGVLAVIATFLAAMFVADATGEAAEIMFSGLTFLGKVSDAAYDKLKTGAKALAAYAASKVPDVKRIMAQAVQVVRDIAARIFQFIRSKTTVTAQA